MFISICQMQEQKKKINLSACPFCGANFFLLLFCIRVLFSSKFFARMQSSRCFHSCLVEWQRQHGRKTIRVYAVTLLILIRSLWEFFFLLSLASHFQYHDEKKCIHSNSISETNILTRLFFFFFFFYFFFISLSCSSSRLAYVFVSVQIERNFFVTICVISDNNMAFIFMFMRFN